MVIDVSDKEYNKRIFFRRYKRKFFISICIFILVLLAVFVIRFFLGEDDWIKDSKGIWIKQGNPSSTPANVLEQQETISCASELYAKEAVKGTEFTSQCLGTCRNYVIDIVHVPRASEDDISENQCSDFLNGKAKHFIELNSQGQIVRIV